MKEEVEFEHMGQVGWVKRGERWEVRHERDQGEAEANLRQLRTLDELEEVVRWDEKGEYRPLRSENNLVSGWRYPAKSEGEYREVMEVIYPGLWGNAEAWGRSELRWPSWEEALGKQTERVRKKVVAKGNMPGGVVQENCYKRCLKVVLWAGERPREEAKTVPMLCTGPCGMFWGWVES